MKKKCEEFSHRKNSPLSPFEQEVEAVLNHYHEPLLLGECSVLTAPYLLHERLVVSHSDDPRERGHVLCNLIKTLVDENKLEDPHQPPRYQRIFQEHYFVKKPHRLSVEKLSKKMGLSPNPFNQSRSAAVRSLAKSLILQFQPALRLESPPQMARQLFGREDDLKKIESSLREGRSVMVTGNGGVGKTALASRVAGDWDRGRVFWHSFRIGFNDQFTSLVFALGYFFHLCGESTLWREALAQTGETHFEKTMQIARSALTQILKQETPLLCFDEVDILNSEQTASHHEVLQLIDILHTLTPTLIIGQHSELNIHETRPLVELTTRDANSLLAEADIHLKPEEQQRLHGFTHGNPRLLELFIAMRADGASFDEIFSDAAETPTMEYLLRRTLQRMNPTERELMRALSVFRTWAPQDHWQNSDSTHALKNLLSRRLVLGDGHGGVEMLPAYRLAIEKILKEPEGLKERRSLHRMAADVWQTHGNFTEVVFHLIQADERDEAISIWNENRQSEINQGRAAAALHLLDMLHAACDGLSPNERDTLQICRAELQHAQGMSRQALEGLRSMIWHTPLKEIEARHLEGFIANDLSNFAAAKKAFRQGISLFELMGVYIAKLRKGLSFTYHREDDLAMAMREADLAQYEVDNIRGVIFEFLCNYTLSEQHYRAALGWAERRDHEDGIAKTCLNLSALFARLGRSSEAKQYLELSRESAAKVDRVMLLADVEQNAAFVYNLIGEHDNAIAALYKAREIFARFTSQIPADSDASIHQNFAEAYLVLGKWDEAEINARQAIEIANYVEADATRTLGEIFLARGDLIQAEAFISRATELTIQDDKTDPYLAGFAYRVLAKLRRAQGDHEGEQQARQIAIQFFTDINLQNEVDRT
jgi:tetratricopeptide (TPR) repeat protein